MKVYVYLLRSVFSLFIFLNQNLFINVVILRASDTHPHKRLEQCRRSNIKIVDGPHILDHVVAREEHGGVTEQVEGQGDQPEHVLPGGGRQQALGQGGEEVEDDGASAYCGDDDPVRSSQRLARHLLTIFSDCNSCHDK